MDLNVQVGADISQYNRAMQQVGATAQTTANEVSRSLSDAAMQTDRLGGSALSASMRMQQMRSGISAARDGVLAFTVGGQAAERSLLAMGHHINSLVNETGSFKGAMTSLLSSLWGPGGIILGLSVAVELFLKYRDSQKQAAEAKSDFQKAVDESNKSSAEELTKVTALYDATQNENLSREDRLLAVKKLQSEYPGYFANMSKEAILAGQAQKAYDALADSIINKAVVAASEENLKETLKPYVEFIAQQKRIQADIEKQNQDIQAANKGKTGTRFGIVDENGRNIEGFTPAEVGGKQTLLPTPSQLVQDKNGDIKSVEDYKNEVQAKIKDARAAVQAALSDFGIGALLGKPEKTKSAKDGFAAIQEEINKLELQLQDSLIAGKTNGRDFNSPLVVKLNAAIARLKELKDQFDALKNGAPVSFLGPASSTSALPAIDTTHTDPKNTLKEMTKAVKDFKKEHYDEYVDDINAKLKQQATIGKEVTNVFGGGLANAFQSALSGTQSFVSAMGQFLTQLIERLVAAAAAAAILAVILSATGFGAVASFGSIFGQLSGLSGLTSGIGKHASGGITQGSHLAWVGEGKENEAIMPLSKLDQFVNNSGGGFKDGHIIGVMRGQDLLLQYKRANKSHNRIS